MKKLLVYLLCVCAIVTIGALTFDAVQTPAPVAAWPSGPNLTTPGPTGTTVTTVPTVPTLAFEKYFIFTDKSAPAPDSWTIRLTPEEKEMFAAQKAAGSYVENVLMPSLDDQVMWGAFYAESVWTTKLHGTKPVQMELQHTHDYDECINFLGSDPDNQADLGGAITIWLEDEKYTLTETSTIYIPRGMKHGPVYVDKIDRYWNSQIIGMSGQPWRNWQEEYGAVNWQEKESSTEGKYAKYIISMKPSGAAESGVVEAAAVPDAGNPGKHVFAMLNFLNGGAVPGHPEAFFMGSSWSMELQGGPHVKMEYESYHDFNEVLGLFGSDPYSTDLGAEMEAWLQGERYIMTESFLEWIPAGMKHNPQYTNRIDRPYRGFWAFNASAPRMAWEEPRN